MSRTHHTESQFALDLEDNTPGNTTQAEPRTPVDNSHRLASLTDTETLLLQWQQAGWIRPLDTGFARLIRELSEEQGERPQPLVLLLAALTSHQVGRGHVCIDLATLLADAGNTLALPPEEPAHTNLSEAEVANLQGLYPQDLLARVQLADCLAALKNSLAISDGSVPAPLVLNGTRLYLRRFWRYEQRIAEGIQQRLALHSILADPQSPGAQTLSRALGHLFRSTDPVDYQKLACALAARNRFSVITGGPGTGKTTTVVNLLAALQAVAGESPERAGRKYRIRLAAPTGKAAARLNESIGGAVRKLPLADLPGSVQLDDIPTRVTTLHRLLGSRPDTRQFRHNRDNPLPVDILVIDEASMVDVDLMASSITRMSTSSGLSRLWRNCRVSGRLPSSRCRVVTLVGMSSSTTCPGNWSSGRRRTAPPMDSFSRAAALPVGAASRMRYLRPARSGSSPATACKAANRFTTVVVLPVPGPPVITEKRCRAARAQASFW